MLAFYFSIRLLLAFREKGCTACCAGFWGKCPGDAYNAHFCAGPGGYLWRFILSGVSGMLLLKLLDRRLCRLAPVWGITASGMLFFLTRNINDGYLGFEDWNFFKIPEQLYLNKFTTYVGFTEAGFFSSDYFSLMPWFFLYLAGYYCLRFCEALGGLPKIFDYGSGCLSFFGRRSLLVYLLHQPLLYLLLTLILGGKVLL